MMNNKIMTNASSICQHFNISDIKLLKARGGEAETEFRNFREKKKQKNKKIFLFVCFSGPLILKSNFINIHPCQGGEKGGKVLK